MTRRSSTLGLLPCALLGLLAGGCAREGVAASDFRLEEATIASVHAAITSGQTSCRAIVEAYIARARAYNGVCTSLVTSDGQDVPAAAGYVRAGAPLRFPTKTIAASTIFPDLDQYQGLPLE